jgi:hypothetical protein
MIGRSIIWVRIRIWWFTLCGCALVAISLPLAILQIADPINALLGVAGFLLVSLAVASDALTYERHRWFLLSAVLIWITGALFVLPDRVRPPNSLYVAAIALLGSGVFALWRGQRY